MKISLLRHTLHSLGITALLLPAVATATETKIATPLGADYFSNNSILSQGRWVKIKVTQTGIQQITADELAAMGFDDPAGVAVYGFPATSLADNRLTEDTPDDLPALPTAVVDGKLIFYGVADVDSRLTNSGTTAAGITFMADVSRNLYADYGCYFLTRSHPANPIATSPLADNPANQITSGLAIHHHEDETSNPARLSPYLFGRSFLEEPVQTYTFALPGLLDGAQATVQARAAVQTTSNANKIKITAPDNTQLKISLRSTQQSDYAFTLFSGGGLCHPKVSADGLYSLTFDLSEAIRLQYGHLDYFTVTYRRANTFAGDTPQQTIHYPYVNSGDRVVIPTAVPGMMVWDVSDPLAPLNLQTGELPTAGDEPPSGDMPLMAVSSPRTYNCATGHAARLVTFNPRAELHHVEYAGEVANQNLHAGSSPRMIIISASAFLEQAQQLADAHKQLDGLDVAVVCQDMIYNEFSSGTPHLAALRRYVKMLYDRGGARLRSALIFGRSSVDHRAISMGNKQTHMQHNVPMLHDQGSYCGHRSKSYATDSYIGMMEPDADSFDPLAKTMDIAVARIPCDNTGEAADAVGKTIAYLNNPPHPGALNAALLTCDKGDVLGHMQDAMGLGNVISQCAPSTVIYQGFDNIFPIKNGKAEVLNSYITNTLSKGVSFWGYSGHSTPLAFAAEPVWNVDMAKNATYDVPPFSVFATCRTLYFDHPGTAVAEACLFNPNGGSIAVVAAMREVYKEKNQELNLAIGRRFFTAETECTLGEIFRLGRNDMLPLVETLSNDIIINTLSYNYIGDPEIPARRPDLTARITFVNNTPYRPTEEKFNIPSGRKITIKGEIANADGSVATDFNGRLSLSIFGGEYTAKVVNISESGTQIEKNTLGTPVEYNDEIIFEKLATVAHGCFSFDVNIPAPQRGAGFNRITLVAANTDNTMHASGWVGNAMISTNASDTPPLTDATIPVIQQMYLDTPSFADGDLVGGNTVLYATIAPNEIGVAGNSSLLGRSMQLTLDGSRSISDAPYRFVADTGGGGTLEVPVTDIADGRHTLSLRVVNHAGQSATRTIAFTVVNVDQSSALAVEEYPATEQATIVLTHSFNNTPRGRLVVKNGAGKVVYTETNVQYPVVWNLTDNRGNPLPDGPYTVETYLTDGRRYGSATPAPLVIRR